MLFSAVVLSKMLWWMLKPVGFHHIQSITNPYIKSEDIATGIGNRAPFGIVLVEKVDKPSDFDQVISQVKLVGVYAAGKNSIAFLQISGKNSLAQINDNILSTKLKRIESDSIVVSSNNQYLTIHLSGATSNSSSDPSNNSYRNKTNFLDNDQSNDKADNYDDGKIDNSKNLSNDDDDEDDDDMIAKRRRRLIEEFQRQNQNN
ncbi:MAG: hypothetical protein RLZZ293_1254, partial [Pseudomonadota bacterium]|jgi:hypothetical protein